MITTIRTFLGGQCKQHLGGTIVRKSFPAWGALLTVSALLLEPRAATAFEITESALATQGHQEKFALRSTLPLSLSSGSIRRIGDRTPDHSADRAGSG